MTSRPGLAGSAPPTLASTLIGGSSGQVQYNNSSAFAGAANVTIVSDNLTLATSTPAAAAAGKVAVHGMSLGGRATLAMRSPAGRAAPVSPLLGCVSRLELIPVHNSGTALTVIGAATPSVNSASGTGTARAIATGTFFGLSRRIGYVSSGTAGSTASLRVASAQFCLGDVAGAGGFLFVCRFGISDASAVANARMFVGLHSATSAIGNVDPSSLTNLIGVGCDAGATNLYMMHNDGAGTATTVDLTATFPTNTRSTDLYELVLYAQPNGSTVGYRVTRLNTGDTTTGTLSSDLPANTTLLAPHVWRNNGSTAVAVGIDLGGLYIETDA